MIAYDCEPVNDRDALVSLAEAIVADSAELIDVAPSCVGRHELFEPSRRGECPEMRIERRTAALSLCAECPAMPDCRRWLDRQRRYLWAGWVIAGEYINH